MIGIVLLDGGVVDLLDDSPRNVLIVVELLGWSEEGPLEVFSGHRLVGPIDVIESTLAVDIASGKQMDELVG